MQTYDHQQKIIEDDPKKCLIALGTGGGKTRVALELARGRILVICPKQQKLDRTWERNAEKFDIASDVKVMSKEEFRRDAEGITAFDTVIFDECHTVLGVTPDTRTRKGIRVPKASQLFEETAQYLERNCPERVYFCSATPVTKPMNLWALATLLGKKWDFFRFRERFYFEKKIGFRSLWIPRKDKASREKLAELTKSFGYTGQLSDWFEVPEQHHETIYVPLSGDQRRAIEDIENSEADPMAVRARVRTIENGILYELAPEHEGDRTVRLVRRVRTFADNKIGIIEELCRKYKKVLIFAAYTGQVGEISSAISRMGNRKVWTLTGATKDRGTVIQAAEEASEAVVIAQASISEGYELPSFRCCVFASKDWQVKNYIQGLGRILRGNNIQENWYYHLVVKGGMDEHCHKSIMEGENFHEMVMEN